jgi:RNA polymerase sigma-70 factor, ECF subfamily
MITFTNLNKVWGHVRKKQSGMLDRPGFELLFKGEYKGLCFFAMKYVKDIETSREIVQDAFVSLWEKKDTIDLSKQVRSYLSTSVRNKCLNWLRNNRKFNNTLLDVEDLPHEIRFDPPDRMVMTELSERIETSLDELPEKCREVFRLSRSENLKYNQIAEQLGISVKTVEAQMSKALQHMRTRLAEYLTLAILVLIFYK